MSEVQVSAASCSSTPATVASAGDYIALMKPTVMSLAVFTAAVGMAIAPVHLHPVLAITALMLIAMGAGAAGALNMSSRGGDDIALTPSYCAIEWPFWCPVFRIAAQFAAGSLGNSKTEGH